MPIDRPTFHLAQVNIGIVRAPVTSPELADFVAQLDPINAIADRSPGFVWRLQSDAGNATSIHAFDDERILMNMSVWRSLEELRDYVYGSAHVELLRRRSDWFERMSEVHLALWWLPTDRLPTVEEAKWRVELVRRHGPTAEAFTFRSPFGPPDVSRRRRPAVGAEFCWTA
jgi:Domain of unknown function (DUF3291)